jgi:hypothetical protein
MWFWTEIGLWSSELKIVGQFSIHTERNKIVELSKYVTHYDPQLRLPWYYLTTPSPLPQPVPITILDIGSYCIFRALSAACSTIYINIWSTFRAAGDVRI